jgi:hypothetical protein
MSIASPASAEFSRVLGRGFVRNGTRDSYSV